MMESLGTYLPRYDMLSIVLSRPAWPWRPLQPLPNAPSPRPPSQPPSALYAFCSLRFWRAFSAPLPPPAAFELLRNAVAYKLVLVAPNLDKRVNARTRIKYPILIQNTMHVYNTPATLSRYRAVEIKECHLPRSARVDKALAVEAAQEEAVPAEAAAP